MPTIPFFSIVMGAYNTGKYIPDAIDSVLQQTYSDWELIIVDDGSTDNTGRILDKYAERDYRIKVFHQRNSGSVGSPRNSALKYVSGEYIQLLDSDDILSKDLLEKHKQRITETESDIVVPMLFIFDDNGKYIRKWCGINNDTNMSISGFEAFELSISWNIHGCNTIKSDIVKSIQWETEIPVEEVSSRKFFYASKKVSFSNGIYYYRSNHESITHSKLYRPKMYNGVKTKYNIYLFTLEKCMKKKIIKRCAKLFLQSLVQNQQIFNREKSNLVKVDRIDVRNILINMYKKVNLIVLWQAKSKYTHFYILSLKSYNLFSFLVLLGYKLKKVCIHKDPSSL
jgi:glycosyltransferase involved in cell wall biosynthesis